MLKLIEKLIDLIFFLLPQKRPTQKQAEKAKLVAHRGAHQYGAKENTLKGFEMCIAHRIWGIEFDIRWTKDHEPILIHDVNADHVFHRPEIIPNQLTISELKRALPEIPTLEEVVRKFGQKIHFMIELKECFSSHSRQIKRLVEVLAPLRPSKDYHILSLRPEELLALSEIPKEARIGISFLNTKEIAEMVISNAMGGHCGHYFLLNIKIQRRHEALGKKTGTGYVSSKNALYREINRAVNWIFTNKPFEIQKELNLLKQLDQ